MLQTLLDSCAALGVPLTAAQAEQLCDFGARLLEQNPNSLKIPRNAVALS